MGLFPLSLPLNIFSCHLGTKLKRNGKVGGQRLDQNWVIHLSWCHKLLRYGLIPFQQSFHSGCSLYLSNVTDSNKNIGSPLSSILIYGYSSFLFPLFFISSFMYSIVRVLRLYGWAELLWTLLTGSNMKYFVTDWHSLVTIVLFSNEGYFLINLDGTFKSLI